jgi:hypothetical protein
VEVANAELLKRRRDRAIAIVLGVKERQCDHYLPADVSAKLRKVILDQFNDLFDACLDVSRSDDGPAVVLNELYQQKLDSALEGVEEIRRLLGVA